VAVLEYLASVDVPLGVAEISRELSLNKVSVFRILSSLEEAGWVIKEHVSPKYRLSENLLMFGLRLISRIELQKVAVRHLYELAQMTGETTALSIRLGLERIFLQEVPGRYAIGTTIHIGANMPLWMGADGKSMLAFLPADDIEKVFKQLENPQLALTFLGRKVDVQKLKEELVKIKEQGYAISAGEYHPNGCAVASPIFGHNHDVIGSLRLRGLLPHFNHELAEKYAPFVTKIANNISRELGVTIATS
jgi:DNA-binding IclR family transcriptional regulator